MWIVDIILKFIAVNVLVGMCTAILEAIPTSDFQYRAKEKISDWFNKMKNKK